MFDISLFKKYKLQIAVSFLTLIFVLTVIAGTSNKSTSPISNGGIPFDTAGDDDSIEMINKLVVDSKHKESELIDKIERVELLYRDSEEKRKADLKEIKEIVKSVKSIEPQNQGITSQDIEFIVREQLSKLDIDNVEVPVANELLEEDSHEINWISDINGSYMTEHSSPSVNTNATSKNIVYKKYTIPENSTLTDSVLLTPLIGRVPVNGKITSPYPFKVMVGGNNLASNGFEMPALKGIVAQGESIGDMTLGCSSGNIHSLTFTFEDGAIVTKKSNGGIPIGFISNEYGNPCIPGKFISNAPEYLAKQSIIAATEGAASAFSEAQMNRNSDTSGNVNSVVNGSISKYVLGKSASNSANSVREWYAKRIDDSFDVVYVPQDTAVAIHINTEIPIDKSDFGRKVIYKSGGSYENNNELD